MDGLSVCEFLLKQFRERKAQLAEVATYGSVPDWNTYQKLVGEVSGLTFAENEIKDLLKKMEKANG